jgi:hypothetical protein
MPTPYSSKDSRKVPNLSRNVRGTLIYDVQTSDNAAIPPVNSRKARPPADSRAAGNVPVNSRAPGVNGPGN